MRDQQTRGEEIGQLLPEHGIYRRVAFDHVGRTQEQPRCNGIRMPRSLQEIATSRRTGFNGNTLKRPVREIELNDIDGPWDVPTRA